jgi:hypothetical protein
MFNFKDYLHIVVKILSHYLNTNGVCALCVSRILTNENMAKRVQIEKTVNRGDEFDVTKNHFNAPDISLSPFCM